MYSDFEKAFDEVPRARLLSKPLYLYGISNTVINVMNTADRPERLPKAVRV